jgi:prevent-host-death family protein
MKMGLRQANQQFSKAVKAVRAGREVVLTDRGKPIAVIKPMESSGGKDTAIRRLEAAGFLRPAVTDRPMRTFRPCRLKGMPLSSTLREERNED